MLLRHLPPNYEALPTSSRPSTFFGLGCLFFGTAVPLGIASVLFKLSAGQPSGGIPWYQILVLIAAYTFVFTIGAIFLTVGLLLLSYRRTDGKERKGHVFLQIARIGGITFATQQTTLSGQINFEMAEPVPKIPASIAALVSGAGEKQATDSGLLQRLQSANATSDKVTTGCLRAAIAGLLAESSAKVFRAEILVQWPRFLGHQQFHSQEFLLVPGDNVTKSGGLELVLDEKIRSWSTLQQGDHPFPTVTELSRSFEDSDGDFSHFQVRNAAEAYAVSRGWLKQRPRVSLRRISPEPEVLASSALAAACRDWAQILSRMEHSNTEFMRHLESSVQAVVEGRQRAKSELDRAQSRLRRKTAGILVLCAAALATCLVLIARV